MKKIFKYISLTLIASTFFLSCSADSSQGMLRLIIDSVPKTSYTINKSSFSSNSSNTLDYSYFVSAENDGIYKEFNSTSSNADSSGIERVKYANSEELRGVKSIYTDGETTYVLYIKVDTNGDPTPTIIYFDNSKTTPTFTTSVEYITGTPINLTSNGYLITEVTAQSYNIYKLDKTGAIIPPNTLTLDPGEIYFDYAVLGTDKLVITTSDNYYYDDGTTIPNKFSITTNIDTTHQAIVAVSELSASSYMLLTANGNCYSGDISQNTTPIDTVVYDNGRNKDTFKAHVPTITIGNYLLAMDNTDYIYAYDCLTPKVRYNTSNDRVMPYASDLNNSSPIIYIEEIHPSAITSIHTYWIATQYNGFYTIKIDSSAVIDTSSYHSSTSGLVD